MAKQNYNKLELTWIGKGEEPKLEPRILIENPEYSYGDPKSENMLIHGDNLLALKALEQDFSGKIKCIYIDPPYNTGNAFEHYDDGVEHSLWLKLMYERLVILRKLLSKDGIICVQLDDNEQAYLKVLMDEIFGRENYINTVVVKTKSSSGASGGGEDKRLKKNYEFITIYSKTTEFRQFDPIYQEIPLRKYVNELRSEGTNFAYNSIMIDFGEKEYLRSTVDGRGEEIKIFKHKNYTIKSVNEISRTENLSFEEVVEKYIDRVFTLENAQTSIRQRVVDSTSEDDEFCSIEYYPVSGRSKGKLTEVGFIGKTKRLVSFLSNTCVQISGKPFKRIKIGTLWDDLSWSSVSFEGGVAFPNGKKPEALIQRILEMSSDEGDIVLDSFLGSGTTAAAAHKLKRRWIGVELGDQALTHVFPRLKGVVDGDKTGISKSIEWKGGGGFKFYNLAPSLLNEDKYGNWIISKEFNAQMLASAVAKQEGFKYEPNEHIYWKQGMSSEKDFIFTTTQFITAELMDKIHEEMQSGESLLIACKSYQEGCENRHANISIKKIPHMLMGRCEYGKDDYSFNIVNMPVDENAEPWETPEEAYIKPLKKTSKTESQPGLFDNE